MAQEHLILGTWFDYCPGAVRMRSKPENSVELLRPLVLYVSLFLRVLLRGPG